MKNLYEIKICSDTTFFRNYDGRPHEFRVVVFRADTKCAFDWLSSEPKASQFCAEFSRNTVCRDDWLAVIKDALGGEIPLYNVTYNTMDFFTAIMMD